MEALSVLMPLLQMGMSGSQSAMNTGMGLIPTIMSLVEGWRARTDPLMRRFSSIIGDRYNQAVEENPYGDPYGAWGGMFGQNAAGGNIGVGEAQARGINQMMQQNPAVSGIQNYQQLAQAQRPGVVDTTAGLSKLMGYDSQFSSNPYQQQSFIPATPDMGAALNTNFSGSPAPRDMSEYQVDERLFGRGGVGSNLVDMVSGLDQQGLSNILQIGGGLARLGGAGQGGGGGSGIEWGPRGSAQNQQIIQSLLQPGALVGRLFGGGGGTKSNTGNVPGDLNLQHWERAAAGISPADRFGRVVGPNSTNAPRRRLASNVGGFGLSQGFGG